MIRQGLFILLMALSTLSIASNTQDVIHKKDGSILKGTLIEQDFEKGQYRIELLGGSIFVVQQNDIAKITKEEKAITSTENDLDRIANTYRNNTPAYDASLSSLPASNPTTFEQALSGTVFYIGTLSHIIRIDIEGYYGSSFEEVVRYKGIKLGAQKNYTENIAAQVSLNSGKLNSIEIVDSDGYIVQEYSDSELIDERYLGLSASVIASTNLQRGWQFYTGLGLMHDEYSSDFSDDTYTSLGIELGMGYSWQTLQLALQYQAEIAGDYPSEFSVGNLNFQLGFNFN